MDSPEQNPIVELAMKLRARRDLGAAIDAAAGGDGERSLAGTSAETLLRAFGEDLQIGAKRLGSILGPRAMTFVRLEKPLRIRLRFRGREEPNAPPSAEKRIGFDLDAQRELVVIRGLQLDGEYQFDSGAAVPSLINLSKLSTEAGYGEAITPSFVLKRISQDAELPRPPHLDGAGPLQF